MRTLAIDPGSRRVGLALSDAVGRLATPYDVLQVRSLGQSIDPILKIIQSEGVQRVVLGLPLNMDGTRGPGAQMAIAFGADLTAHGVKSVVFVDERLSTFAAEQNLLDRKRGGEKITRKKKKADSTRWRRRVFFRIFWMGSWRRWTRNNGVSAHRAPADSLTHLLALTGWRGIIEH